MQAYQPRALEVQQVQPRPVAEDISIVIPTLGRPILEESLYWIVQGSLWPGEVIVVDQGRRQAVAGLLDKLPRLGIGAQYVPSEQRGRAAGLNRGLERVGTRFAAITDDDCFVESDWLAQMLAALRQHPHAIVTGRVEAAGDDMIVVVTSREPATYRRPSLKFDHMSGGNVGAAIKTFREAGYFDEHPSLATAEDGEFAYRALRRGAYIVYVPEMGVRHFGWRDKEMRDSQYRGYARSHGAFYGKYLRRWDGFIALRAVLHFSRALRRWARGVISGDDEMAHLGRAYVMGLLPGIISGMQRR